MPDKTKCLLYFPPEKEREFLRYYTREQMMQLISDALYKTPPGEHGDDITYVMPQSANDEHLPVLRDWTHDYDQKQRVAIFVKVAYNPDVKMVIYHFKGFEERFLTEEEYEAYLLKHYGDLYTSRPDYVPIEKRQAERKKKRR